MPGIFPPQWCNGYQLVDGGVAENMPLEVAVSEGANLIFAIQYNCCKGSNGPVHGLLKILSRAFSIALDRKTMCDIRHYQSKAKLIILEPTFGLNIDLLDFRYSAQLIEKAYLFAKDTLNNEIGSKP